MSNSVPNHNLETIKFLGSFPRVDIAPRSSLPEFAFIGRSNVGKSSLINYISGRKKLAKTSGTPGKTQLINLFQFSDQWILADLPGYGYARISKKMRAKWSVMIEGYLLKRENLKTVFILIDSRLTPQDLDLDKIIWLGTHHIPFSIIFTKSDKLKPVELENNVALFLERLSQDYSDLPNYFITSSTSKSGAEDVLDYIEFVSSSVE